MPPDGENGNAAPDVPVDSPTPEGSGTSAVVVSDTAPVDANTPVTPEIVPVSEPAPTVEATVPEVQAAAETAQNQATSPEVAPTPTGETAQTVGIEPLPTAGSAEAVAPVIVKRNDVREFLRMALEKISGKKAKKLAKIMDEVNRKGKISNDQVEKLLHCSDASATRYLSELEREGKLRQSGKTGRGVVYVKV